MCRRPRKIKRIAMCDWQEPFLLSCFKMLLLIENAVVTLSTPNSMSFDNPYSLSVMQLTLLHEMDIIWVEYYYRNKGEEVLL